MPNAAVDCRERSQWGPFRTTLGTPPGFNSIRGDLAGRYVSVTRRFVLDPNWTVDPLHNKLSGMNRLETNDANMRIYQPVPQSVGTFWLSLTAIIAHIWVSRDLILALYQRDFLLGNRRSFLGVGWYLAAPIFSSASWLFMNYAGVMNPGYSGTSYLSYLLAGTTLWAALTASSLAVADSFNIARSFILQVRFHREALFAKQLLQQLTMALISLTFCLVSLVLLGWRPSVGLLWLPLTLAPLFLASTALGLIVATLSIVLPDFKRIYEIGLSLLVFTTPVFFSAKIPPPMIQSVIAWNPFTYLIVIPRDVILTGQLENPAAFAGALVGSMIFLVFSLRVFVVSERLLIEKMV